MPVLVAACAAVKAELNENTATAAIKMLRVRIKFLPNVQHVQSPNQRGMSVAVPPALSAKDSGHCELYLDFFVRAEVSDILHCTLCPLYPRKRTFLQHIRFVCGRLRVGKTFLHVCSIGRCSHVFGLT